MGDNDTMGAIVAENANADEFDLLPKLQEVSGVPMPQAIKDILDAIDRFVYFENRKNS